MGHLPREAGPRCWDHHHLPVGGKIAKVDVQLTLLCSVPGQDSSCSVPCSEIGT